MVDRIVINDIEAIKVLADPLRMKIVHLLQRTGPSSATAIAEELGESASKISYHVKLLEKHGITFLKETRTKGNLIENIFSATASEFLIQHDIRQGNDGDYDEAVHGVIKELLALLSSDLLELPRQRKREFTSTISYDTYYLTLAEIEHIRESVLSQLRAFSLREPASDLLACNIGFLLLDKDQGGKDYE